MYANLPSADVVFDGAKFLFGRGQSEFGLLDDSGGGKQKCSNDLHLHWPLLQVLFLKINSVTGCVHAILKMTLHDNLCSQFHELRSK